MVCARLIRSSTKGDIECVSYVSKKWPKCAKFKGDQRYIGTLALCLFLMVYAFTLLSPSHHLCSPITMRHLALLSYS